MKDIKIVDGKINGIKVSRWEDTHRELMQQPEYKEVFDALEEEFALHFASNEMREKGNTAQAEHAIMGA